MSLKYPNQLLKMKEKQEKIVMLTAYDYTMARLVDRCGVDMVLVGDSAGGVMAGHETTLPMTLDQMIYHTQCVVRGFTSGLVVADMPFMSYQVSVEQARENAGRFIKEGGARAVKMEVSQTSLESIQAVLDIGIPVMGHIGFTPQTLYKLGGYKVQGREKESADVFVSLAKELEAMGCFSVLLEMVPAELAKKVSAALRIPTIGIGAGVECDGQVLVIHDVLGFSEGAYPSFTRQYTQLFDQASTAVSAFVHDVKSGAFPDAQHSFN